MDYIPALPRTTAVVNGNDGVTQNVAAGASLPDSYQGETLQQTLARLRRQAEESQRNLSNLRAQDVDVSALEQYGKTRAEGGQNAMLNALAAQFAGDRFGGVQDAMLKRSLAAQQEMKLGQGMVTPDGKFIRDPYALRDAAERRAQDDAQFYDKQATAVGAQIQSMEDRKAAREEAARQREMDRQLRRELAQDRAGNAQPYYSPVQTAQGVYVLNARTGLMKLITNAEGQPIIGSASDPTLQGTIAGAKTAAQEGAKSASADRAAVKRSTQMLDALDQAEQLLMQNPTQSRVGALRDAAGNLVGASSQSADTAAKLESISGWLTANVPRMEGPQSNFDVQNYQTMAGMVGDRTRPVRQRLAALEEVRKLQEKYRALNEQTAAPAPQGAQPRKRIRYDSQGNEVKE